MNKILPIYIVDAFSSQAFGGNPAAVCLLPSAEAADDNLKQKIAAEMNLSETAFVIPIKVNADKDPFKTESHFQLRWFTPTTEVPLCGHATLASAAVLFAKMANTNPLIHFETLKSGVLTAERKKEQQQLMVEMRLPLNPATITIAVDDEQIWHLVSATVGEENVKHVKEVKLSPTTKKLLIRMDTDDLEGMKTPNMTELVGVATGNRVMGVIVTSEKGDKYDFVSRYFAPWVGIPEDPVTGSAHTVLAPYWAQQLKGKNSLFAKQCSRRGGELWIEVEEDCVKVSGEAAIVLQGTFQI